MISKKLIACIIIATMLTGAAATGCSDKESTSGSNYSSADASVSDEITTGEDSETNSTSSSDTGSANLANMDLTYTDRDLDANRSTSGATSITLKSSSISVSGSGASVSGAVVTIQSAGTYTVSGTLSTGQIIVAAGEQDKVQLVFNGVNITCSNHAPIYIKSADKVFITLTAGTSNSITDGSSYSLSEADSAVDGAVFSKADLTINGTGALTVKANYQHGIVSKDDLVITGGVYNITSESDGFLNGFFQCTKCSFTSFNVP